MWHIALALGLTFIGTPVIAQEAKEPLRTRVGLGAQLVPSYPGSDRLSVRPLVDVSRARGAKQFAFEAPDESFGFAFLNKDGLAIGPAIGFEGSRTAKDVGATLPEVGFTFEAGGFVQYSFSDRFRVRAEVRQGLGGHKGLISNVGADFVSRNGDEWLFSIGPRLTLADADYHQAYFGVSPAAAAASGLPSYSLGGGIQSAGVTSGYWSKLSGPWGLHGYAKYDRLLGDAADSPIVMGFGSKDQLSGGVALTYTFGGT
jgi:outer membrane scaffolding protein for murein synthesis (MipA/OmpV family)